MTKEFNPKGLNQLDDPKTTIEHGKIIQNKPILKAIYDDWYDRLIANIGPTETRNRG